MQSFVLLREKRLTMRYVILGLLVTVHTLSAAPVHTQGIPLLETDLDASVIDRKLEDEDEDKEKGESGYQFSIKGEPLDKDEDIASSEP